MNIARCKEVAREVNVIVSGMTHNKTLSKDNFAISDVKGYQTIQGLGIGICNELKASYGKPGVLAIQEITSPC